MRKQAWVLIVVAGLAMMVTLSLAASAPQVAPAPKVDIGALSKETALVRLEGNRQTLANWLSFEYYVAFATGGDISKRGEAEKALDYLKPYLTICVREGITDATGDTKFTPESQIRARRVLRLPDGTDVALLDNVPPKVAQLAEGLKEGNAKTGVIVSVLVFSGQGKDGKPIIDSAARGALTYVLKGAGGAPDSTFTWHTPFDASTPAMPCPKCHDTVCAKWFYCPWCGQKLAP